MTRVQSRAGGHCKEVCSARMVCHLSPGLQYLSEGHPRLGAYPFVHRTVLMTIQLRAESEAAATWSALESACTKLEKGKCSVNAPNSLLGRKIYTSQMKMV